MSDQNRTPRRRRSQIPQDDEEVLTTTYILPRRGRTLLGNNDTVSNRRTPSVSRRTISQEEPTNQTNRRDQEPTNRRDEELTNRRNRREEILERTSPVRRTRREASPVRIITNQEQSTRRNINQEQEQGEPTRRTSLSRRTTINQENQAQEQEQPTRRTSLSNRRTAIDQENEENKEETKPIRVSPLKPNSNGPRRSTLSLINRNLQKEEEPYTPTLVRTNGEILNQRRTKASGTLSNPNRDLKVVIKNRTGPPTLRDMTDLERKIYLFSLENAPTIELEDIINIVGDMILPYLSEEDKGNLLSTSFNLSKYYFVPIDLSNVKITFKNFVKYFGKRPETNLIGLNIVFELNDTHLSPLLPFLPRLRKFTIHDRTNVLFSTSFLVKCENLTELTFDISIFRIESIKYCTKLLKLTLFDGDIRGSLKYLKECKFLRELAFYDVYANHFDKSGVLGPYEVISEIKSLTHLTLSSVINLERLPSLVKCTNLKLLNILKCKNLIDITGLGNCVSIKDLIFSDCIKLRNFGPLESCIGLKRVFLKTAPPENGIEIELRTNMLIDALDLKELTIINYILRGNSTFEDFRSLKKLILGDIQGELQVPHLPIIGRVNHKNKSAGLEELYIYNSQLDEIKVFANTEELKVLIIMGCNLLTNVDFISNCKKLNKLKINGCPIASFEFLGELWNLEILFLNNLNKNISLDTLGNLTKLRALSLKNTKTALLKGMENYVNLRELSLENTLISDLGILARLPLLESLLLKNCINLDRDSYFSLIKCINLRKLDLSESPIDDTSFLGKMKKLTILDLSKCRNLGYTTKIILPPNIEELYFDDNFYFNPLMLTESKTLKIVSLVNTSIGTLYELTSLNFSNTKLEKAIVGPNLVYVMKGDKLVARHTG